VTRPALLEWTQPPPFEGMTYNSLLERVICPPRPEWTQPPPFEGMTYNSLLERVICPPRPEWTQPPPLEGVTHNHLPAMGEPHLPPRRGDRLPPPEEIQEQVRASGLLSCEGPDVCEGPVVVMLSGGRDSVCLLDLAVGIRGAERVHALHVNYGLRPEAEDDERHCRELCTRLGVALDVVHAPRPPAAGNLQAWARELRYRAAAELAGPREALIAAGHTATDQVETILYRLAASPGRRALLGMAPREGHLVRPLLELTREQTAAYCRARGLAWREDASNDSEQYARARVRNRLLPAFDAVHPAAQRNVLRTARMLREEAAVLDDLVEAQLRGASSIAIERLAELPAALARLVVVRLAERAAGTYVPQAGARVQEILDLATREGRAELHIGGLVAAVVQDGRLQMVKLAPRG
jgi:tRNA(Ile)-lysidine synthase